MAHALQRLCEEHKIRIIATETHVGPPEGWPVGTRSWAVTLHRDSGLRLSAPFHQGSAHTEPPTAADVLYCLISDVPSGEMTFEEFCSELGYDTDSRKAERTWKLCARLAPRVRNFLGEDYDAFAQACSDY